MVTAPIFKPAITMEFATLTRTLQVESLTTEFATTRKVILAVPDDKRAYRPDLRAKTAWELAWHLAVTDVWFLKGIADLKFDGNEDEAAFAAKHEPKNIAEIAAWHERETHLALDRVNKMSGRDLLTPVPFFHLNLPAFAYLKLCQNHGIHHRGQLSTYLRPMGSKVPSIYGPSADEPI